VHDQALNKNKQTIYIQVQDTQCVKKSWGVCADQTNASLIHHLSDVLVAPRRGHKDKGGEPRMNGYGHPPDRTRHLFFFTSDTTQRQLSHTAPYIKHTEHNFYLLIAYEQRRLLRVNPQTRKVGMDQLLFACGRNNLKALISTRKQREIIRRVYTTKDIHMCRRWVSE